MAYPQLTPTKRRFNPGNFPQRTFKSQSGAESRILYGSKRTGMKLWLTYSNISDADAELFLDHYHEMKGTYTTFGVGSQTNAKLGWEGNADALGADAWGNEYRYASPPQLTQVKKGVSHVHVALVGVL